MFVSINYKYKNVFSMHVSAHIVINNLWKNVVRARDFSAQIIARCYLKDTFSFATERTYNI